MIRIMVLIRGFEVSRSSKLGRLKLEQNIPLHFLWNQETSVRLINNTFPVNIEDRGDVRFKVSEQPLSFWSTSKE